MGLIYKISCDSTRLIGSVKIKYPIKNRAFRTGIAAPADTRVFYWTGANNPAENFLFLVSAGKYNLQILGIPKNRPVHLNQTKIIKENLK